MIWLDRFLDRYLGGHFTLGPLTWYGRNAMHWAVNISTRWGYLCLRPPFRCFGRWWPVYAYLSANATPWHHTARGWGRELTPQDCVCDECLLHGRGRYRDSPKQRERDLADRFGVLR